MGSADSRRSVNTSTHLGGEREVVYHVDHIEEDVGIGIDIPLNDIAQARHQPVADALGCLGAGMEEQELLQHGICQYGYQLSGHLEYVQMLDKGVDIFQLFNGDGVLQRLAWR